MSPDLRQDLTSGRYSMPHLYIGLFFSKCAIVFRYKYGNQYTDASNKESIVKYLLNYLPWNHLSLY